MMNPDAKLTIGEREIGQRFPTYFIADISANHDGDLGRAKELVHLAAASGADAAKFQNFTAEKIVSAAGFENLGGGFSHQRSWEKSVFQVYKEASVPADWTPILRKECDLAGIHYFSTPYDFAAVDMLDEYVPAYKIGSGDLNWPEFIAYVAGKGKPVIIATGASELSEVNRAMQELRAHSAGVGLMQCNTNYTGSLENFRHLNLRVLETYALLYPFAVLGLSDHTPGHSSVLGAVALGARLIEKHFTDDTGRKGPDHPFSMTPKPWAEMVARTRELEQALGSPMKCVAENERETVIVQRRALRAARALDKGQRIGRSDIEVLRPAPTGSLGPVELGRLIGKTLARPMHEHECFFSNDLG